ncbi:MAG: hypothetical protein M1294_00835 [Firmicutes bacterium]|nr:hypothetical protein [Bacillota bacterium]
MSLCNPLVSLYVIDLNQVTELLELLSIRSVPSFALNDDILTLTANEWILAQVIRRYGVSDGTELV